MISKLRTKIIVYSFLSVGIVFLIGLVVLLGIGYARLNDDRIARLDNEFAIQRWQAVPTDSIGGMVLAEYDLSSEQLLFKRVGEGVGQSDEQIDQTLQRVVAKRSDKGVFGISMVYSRRVEGDIMRIALYSRGYNSSKETKYLIYTLIALVVGSVAYLIICYFLAKMALRPVETTWKRQRQFVADASHELKTPLAVIRANTDLVVAHKNATVASQMQWIDNIRFETDRMTGLVSDLLFLAKNDEGLKEQLDTVDLSECVEAVALAQETLFYEQGQEFSYEIVPHLTVLGNDGQLKQLVTILLDNANKYSVGKGNVRLTLDSFPTIAGKVAQLEVSNDSMELTDEQTEHLFDRFYTVDQARDKSHTGNGLGLAIAQTICENHEGEINAEYADGRIAFTVQLPLNRTVATKK